jgi:hypothetical protein
LPSTFTVTNLFDSGPGSLRAAITAANTNPGADTIRFAGGLKGTIALSSASGELSITGDLTINGPGASQLTVNGGNVTRVFHVSGATTHLSMAGLTVANGLALPAAFLPGLAAFGGGLLNDGASVSLSHVVFTGNQAGNGTSYAAGGAIANIGGAHLTVQQSSFLVNTANGGTNFGNGGAVDDDQSSIVDIENSTFVANFATGGNANGGAIAHYDNSQLTVANCSFLSNHVLVVFPEFGSGAGGAIETDEGASGFFGDQGQPTTTIVQCSFTGNHCDAGPSPAGQVGGSTTGGAVDLEDRAKVTISNSTFAGNRVRGGDGGDGSAGMDGGQGGGANGGAIFNGSAHLTASNSLFTGNEAHAGKGGAGGSGGGNGGDGSTSLGGAIDATFEDPSLPPTTALSNCLFVGNQAIGGDGGAGGSVGGNGGNGMRADGGAVINLLGTITVTNSLFVGNTSQGGAGGAGGSGGVGGVGGLGRGGGFSNERGGTATVTDTLIVLNQASGGAGAAGASGGNAVGGGVYNGRFTDQGATLEMSNCTVSANLALGGAGGVGGNGGFARGGGIYNGSTDAAGNPLADPSPGSPTLDLDGTTVTANLAVGGAAGSGGVAGTGVGGGLYNDSSDGAVAEVDAHSKIKGNKASTSDDDVFGTVSPI